MRRRAADNLQINNAQRSKKSMDKASFFDLTLRLIDGSVHIFRLVGHSIEFSEFIVFWINR